MRNWARRLLSVFRSLAYFDPAATGTAVKIEDRLLAANPGNSQNLARIGDIYADRELFAKAAPYWERIPRVSPGEAGGYLEAATIYWDYLISTMPCGCSLKAARNSPTTHSILTRPEPSMRESGTTLVPCRNT